MRETGSGGGGGGVTKKKKKKMLTATLEIFSSDKFAEMPFLFSQPQPIQLPPHTPLSTLSLSSPRREGK